MSELSIKVNIAGRTYPLKIKRDENIRKAAKSIDESVKKLQDNYSVVDKQDLLAMAALDLSSRLLGGEDKIKIDNQTKHLTELNAFITSYLSESALPINESKA